MGWRGLHDVKKNSPTHTFRLMQTCASPTLNHRNASVPECANRSRRRCVPIAGEDLDGTRACGPASGGVIRGGAHAESLGLLGYLYVHAYGSGVDWVNELWPGHRACFVKHS